MLLKFVSWHGRQDLHGVVALPLVLLRRIRLLSENLGLKMIVQSQAAVKVRAARGIKPKREKAAMNGTAGRKVGMISRGVRDADGIEESSEIERIQDVFKWPVHRIIRND